jgi:hypothetical protein
MVGRDDPAYRRRSPPLDAGRPGPRVLLTGGDETDNHRRAGGDGAADPPIPAGSHDHSSGQSAGRAEWRHVPLATTDLNRVFPGRDVTAAGGGAGGTSDSHDALIDAHTAGWHDLLLLDNIAEPVMGDGLSLGRCLSTHRFADGWQPNLQGLDRCWTTWVVNNGKPAVTIELPA